MKYLSTRNSVTLVSASQAIACGISPEGGLFVPQTLPVFSPDEILDLCELDYVGRAAKVIEKFLPEFTEDEISGALKGAYGGGVFENNLPAPVSVLGDRMFVLELHRGPTSAFKDMALRLLPRLMLLAREKTGQTGTTLILTATSGDTGKAALEGFKDLPGIKIVVFYPDGKVSEIQRLQMSTQEGENVEVIALEGNFDDCQTKVKELFTDKAFAGRLAENDIRLSSANSINWGRLLPQIAYYFSAYAELVKEKKTEFGEMLDVAVPTGNFGNILAAYYAKKMGLPLGRLICASNKNNVLEEFINTGVYDRRREFYKTTTPSMDILVSSNLERLLFEIVDRNSEHVSELMNALKSEGVFALTPDEHARVKEDFAAGSASDERAAEAINSCYKTYGYLCDPHTAVAYAVSEEIPGTSCKTLLVSTASPYKFAESVLCALGQTPPDDEFRALDLLEKTGGEKIPKNLAKLKGKPVRFDKVCDLSEAEKLVEEFANK